MNRDSILKRLKELDDSSIWFTQVHMRADPHPFVVGARHVAHAADSHGGILDEGVLRDIPCEECKQPYDAHKALYYPEVNVAPTITWPEWQAFVQRAKPVLIELGVEGLAFDEGALEVLKAIQPKEQDAQE